MYGVRPSGGRLWALLLAGAVAAGCDDGGGSTPAPDAACVGCADAAPDGSPGGDAGPADPDAAAPGPDAAPDAEDTAADASPPDADPGPGPAACNSGLGDLPDGLVEIRWDDGQPVADVASQDWTIVGERLAGAVLHEAVRFDLPHPARVHGFAIQYGRLPDDREAPISAGLYPDFGYNGFDFWQLAPYAEATRCRGDIRPGEWVTYRLPEPVTIDHPGLVYVAHRREGEGDAAWLFDGTPPTPDCGNDCCNTFANCHSAWNFPDLKQFQGNYAWNGLSTSFQYDYLVRLYVEYTDELAPEQTIFQPVPGVPASNRIAWGDFDNDGDDDLFLNGPRLLRNDAGTFTDVTAESGIAALGIAGSGVWGDYDNDGCLDVFVFDEANNRPDHLLRNDCDGTFTDVTEAAGIVDFQEYNDCAGEGGNQSPTPAAAWLDIDADGFLDLYLANFICWTDGANYTDTVWRNQGDGTFTEWTGMHGFRGVNGDRLAGRGAAPADFDQDGDVDLLVNNYRLNYNLFYLNNGDGTVTQAAGARGLGGNESRQGVNRYYGHSIGAAWGDLNGDGWLDVVVGNLAHPRFYDFSDKTQVLIADGEGRFTDIQGDFAEPMGATGIAFRETHSVPTLADFDHDGALDLVISQVYDGRPTDFYWGNGDGTFRLDSYHAGITTTNGWGMAVADFDHDGDLDLATSTHLFRNTSDLQGKHWLQVRAVGNVRSNRAALGATVRVHAGERSWIRHVNGGTGQGNQDSLYVHFGLADAATIDRVEVLYIGGGLVTYDGPFDTDQRLWVYEDGTVTPGWAGTP